MALSQNYIGQQTSMGATLVEGGATFRVWAPRALRVHLRLMPATSWVPDESNALVRLGDGTWGGFVPGMVDGDPYCFWVRGLGSEGPKRDPYARELGPGFPNCDCVVRAPRRYPWHDRKFRPPPFSNLIIYQFHVGTFYGTDARGRDSRPSRGGTFLDVLDRVPYLVELGVTAIQPLPIVEFATEHSLGYNGTDYFSPEMDYTLARGDLARYLVTANQLLAARGHPPLTLDDLGSHGHQLKALIDICHVYGLAVILDVVYNHAGGDFGDESLYFFDRAVARSNADSLYFTDQGWAGGLVFAFDRPEVRQFLIDNATFYVDEYHIDGFRYDEVTVIDRFGGWRFCQDLTGTLHFVKPSIPQIAEFWNPDPSWAVRSVSEAGAGFDAVWSDRARSAVRQVIAQAARGREAPVDLDVLRDALARLPGFDASWRAVQHLENHDVIYSGHVDRLPRIAALCDATNARSWYARSRARVAMALLLTAPGIPMLFMGQEFLEDKFWSDTPDPATLIFWEGLTTDPAMQDHLRCTQDLIRLRRSAPALRGESHHVVHVHNDNRIIAYHRWLEGQGADVMIVASLSEETWWSYRVGFPGPGRWREIFNSDVYDHFPNPWAAGNGGAVSADGPAWDGMPTSAELVIPANGALVFSREADTPA